MSQLYALLLDEPQHSNSVLLTRDQKGVLHRIRMTDSTVKELKVKRRNAKAALTRQGKALRLMIEGNRATDEVSSQLEKFELVYDSLVQKHEAYTEQISDDDEFTTEEEWLEECQQMFIALQCETKDHLHVTPTPTEKESNRMKKPVPVQRKRVPVMTSPVQVPSKYPVQSNPVQLPVPSR